MFLTVAHLIHGQGAGMFPDLELLSIVLTGVGVVIAIASAVIVPTITRNQMFFTTIVLRSALAESVTILGFVLAMQGADMQWTYILTGLGVLAQIAAFPSEREREAHERRRA
jgi:F0F1-type ATP synthase membrane subunit c/vacuolar-type H+-ATPase subunit K